MGVRVLALDPGGRTGVALWDSGQFWSTHLGTYEAWSFVDAQLNQHHFDLVVSEDFTITAGTAKKSQDGKKSIESIGVFRFLCAKHTTLFETQLPSEAKNFTTDARLRHLSMWYKGSDHPRDAARHLVFALSNHGWIDKQSLVIPED